MLIEIWTEELPAGWEWSPNNYVGGTPEFVVNTAEVMAKDHDVFVYYDGPVCERNRVFYVGRNSFSGDDVVLSCNSKPPRLGRYNIYWTNWHHQRQENCKEFDERIVLSPYQKSIFGDNSRIVPHSCWPEQFSNPVKTPNTCLYSSSPDRGGDYLKTIWPEVQRRTGAKLICTYDKSIYESQMIDLYKSSQFWLHPGQGVELCCIAAIKAQVAECIPVVVPNMALDTTVKWGVKTSFHLYKESLISAILNPPPVQKFDFGTWETVTKDLFKCVLA